MILNTICCLATFSNLIFSTKHLVPDLLRAFVPHRALVSTTGSKVAPSRTSIKTSSKESIESTQSSDDSSPKPREGRGSIVAQRQKRLRWNVFKEQPFIVVRCLSAVGSLGWIGEAERGAKDG